MNDALRSFIDANRPRYLDELTAFLKIPSISALPAHTADMRCCAQWTATALQRSGLHNIRLIETSGNPVVYGEWLGAPGAPTVLCYGHYDVQPVDPASSWDSPPFAPTVRDRKLYARGASDNKGQIYMHLKAIEAHLRRTSRLPVNIKVMVEGDEEAGAGSVEQFVQQNRDLLGADVIVISDGAMFARAVPSICCGLRGIVYLEIHARGPATDLHSGSHGGAVANPAIELARILAQIVDADGRIAIPGFYEKVQVLSSDERASLARLPFSEDEYLARVGAPRLHGEPDHSLLERLWTRPTCDVNGLLSGFTDTGTKTIIPSRATAKLSMRLVPDQEPDEIASLAEAYVREIAPPTVDIQVRRMPGGGRPWTTNRHEFMHAAVRALEATFGVAPVFAREGGSNPLVSTFQDTLNVPIVLFDLGLPDDNPHAPNEKMELQQLWDGTLAAARLYEELSRV